MKHKLSLIQQFVSYTTVFTVGMIGFNLAAIVQRSFAQTPPLQMAQSSPIEGRWRLANMTEPGSPMPLVPSQKPELTADFVGDRVSGSGGCNRFSGGFEAEGSQLSIGPLASTFMACDPPIMQQETKYLTALQNAQRYEVSPEGLEITYQTEKGVGVLRFIAQGVKALW